MLRFCWHHTLDEHCPGRLLFQSIRQAGLLRKINGSIIWFSWDCNANATPAERNSLNQPCCAVTLANHICMLKSLLGHGETKGSTEVGNGNDFLHKVKCQENQQGSWLKGTAQGSTKQGPHWRMWKERQEVNLWQKETAQCCCSWDYFANICYGWAIWPKN